MNPEEYAAAQAVISARAAQQTLSFASMFTFNLLSLKDWLQLLQFLFPRISDFRYQSAELGRRFYDDQRLSTHPDLLQNKQHLETYDIQRFIKDMEPARKRMSQAESPPDAPAQMALHAVRVVENAGRQQIIHAVESDPAPPHLIRGWARVATGRETCAWCLMLVSRGPVYLGADRAGLDLGDSEAVNLISSGQDVSAFMQQWHPGCDCKVVPVWKLDDWHGQAA
jgi:hypothetical protein